MPNKLFFTLVVYNKYTYNSMGEFGDRGSDKNVLTLLTLII